jgi:hypothetical protein
LSWSRKLWLLLLALLLWPIAGFVRYALSFTPGAGPQGGEAVAVLALLYWSLWQMIAVGQWIATIRRGIGRRWQRAGVALAPLAALVLAILWTDRGWPSIPAGLLVVALLGGSQLWAGWRLGRR